MKLTLDPGAAALLDTLHAAGYAAYAVGGESFVTAKCGYEIPAPAVVKAGLVYMPAYHFYAITLRRRRQISEPYCVKNGIFLCGIAGKQSRAAAVYGFYNLGPSFVLRYHYDKAAAVFRPERRKLA